MTSHISKSSHTNHMSSTLPPPRKQNKSATEVYEQATNCPVAGRTGKIWIEYTQFLEERSRPRTAQKLYLRALVGEGSGEGGDDDNSGPRVTDPADQALLWDGFLDMMRALRKTPDLTLEDLKKAVQKEHLGQSTPSTVGTSDQTDAGGATPVLQASVATTAPASNSAEPPKEETDTMATTRPAKRSRWDKKAPVETALVNASNIDTVTGIIASSSTNLPPEIETLWHARDGGSLPSRPEPPLFTASPPKLGDASGKDLIGNEAALKILQLLTLKTHDDKCLGSALLELCNACWMMTALKEEEVFKAQASLEEKIVSPFALYCYQEPVTASF